MSVPGRRLLRGSAGAPGFAAGPLVFLRAATGQTTDLPTDPAVAAARFAVAQQVVAAEFAALAGQLRAAGKTDEAGIFDAQALLAADTTLLGEVRVRLDAGLPLLAAVRAASDAVAATLAMLDDPYLRERAADIRAVGAQLDAALRGVVAPPASAPGAIVAAREFTPAQVSALHGGGAAGLATASGTATGHVAILARALGCPCVVGLGDALLDLPEGEPALLDASAGTLLVAPTPEDEAAFAAWRSAARAATGRQHILTGVPAATADGHRVHLWANIGHPDEVRAAVAAGAEGVGLFRTEFLFLDRERPPSEEEQYTAYVAALDALAGRPLIARTLDIGGDKPLPYLPLPPEPNPFLGVRGIRVARRYPDLFDTQARALLRAAAHGDLRIMLPLVATPEDVAWAHTRLTAVAGTLARGGVPHRAAVPLGIMVETPAAAVALDLLAAEGRLTFCSIGSNDLAQYTLAADRGNGDLAARYRHDDPAVFRLIRLAVETAQRQGLDISLCGELAADPIAAVVLVGLGLEHLSLAPSALPGVQLALQQVTLAEARERAGAVCRLAGGA
ncbi:MAG: phosphoenolpyruvate--protein phosphotransferase [Thermomicrobiales bacterium]